MKESDILRCGEKCWISKESNGWYVWRHGITHSTVDSAYDDESLAIARFNYIERKTA